MSDRWITVATFHEPVAAAMAKNFLESEGIAAILIDESTIATDWMLAGAIGGIKLQVPPLQLERAELLLAQVQEDKDEFDPDEAPHPAQTAIAIREIAEDLRAERADRAPINQLVDRLFRATVFGLIFWPLLGYSLYLLLKLTGEEGVVSADRRWKVWFAALLSVPLLAALLFGFSCLCRVPLLP